MRSGEGSARRWDRMRLFYRGQQRIRNNPMSTRAIWFLKPAALWCTFRPERPACVLNLSVCCPSISLSGSLFDRLRTSQSELSRNSSFGWNRVDIHYQDMISHGFKPGGWWEGRFIDDANHLLMKLLLGAAMQGAPHFRELTDSLSLLCWYHHS